MKNKKPSIISNLIFDIKRILSLEAFTSKSFGMSDLLLPVCFCDNGILLNKDGSFSQSFWYSGVDLDSSTDEELDYLNSQTYSNAFSHLGDGWVMHLDCIRKSKEDYIKDELNNFIDATTEIIDFERKMYYKNENVNYFNQFVITFTYLPPSDYSERTKNWFMQNKDKQLQVNYFEHLEFFKSKILEVLDLLKYKIYVKPLSNQETLTYYNYCINGFEAEFKDYTNSWIDINYRLATQDLVKGYILEIGDYFVGVVSVGEGLPLFASPALLHELTTLQFEYRWSTRYVFLDKTTSEKLIESNARYHYQNRESIKHVLNNRMRDDGIARVNRSAEVFADQTEEALQKLETENISYGQYTCSVVVFDKDATKLQKKLDEVKKVIANVKFIVKQEKINTLDAYLGTIPGMVYNNRRKWIIDTINLADIMPTTSVWSGYEKNPCRYYDKNNPPLFYALGEGNTPFYGCTFVGDIGHTLIVGPSRSGKSVLLNFLAAQQFRYKNARVYHFDNGNSALPLCFAVNGGHYDIANRNSQLYFKPLAIIDNEDDFSFMVQWLSEIAEINLQRKITSEERSHITKVLEIIQKNGTNAEKSLNYFYQQLKPRTQELADAFKEYTRAVSSTTLKSKIFNAENDDFILNRFNVFELEKLLKTSDDVFVPTIRYLIYMLQRSFDGSPTFIIFEEAWAIIKHPIMQSILEEFLRVAAKKNVAILLCTQQLNDILKAQISDVLLDQCKTKIYLPNPNILNNDETAKIYQQFGLNNKQLQLIGNAIPQCHYYFSNQIGNRLFNLNLGDVALTFLAKTGMEDIKLAYQYKAKYKNLFAYHWLKHFRLNDVAEYWMHLYNEKVN